MGVAELLSAFRDNPAGVDEDDLLEDLVKSIISPIPSDTAVVTGVLQVDPHDSVSGAIRQGYAYGDGIFIYDATDTTTAHDGITCLVLIGGYRYKVQGNLRIKAVEQVGIDSEPSLTDSDFGKAYIDLTGVVGDANDIIVWTSRGWVEVDPDYGPPIFVKNANGDYPANSYVHWQGDDGWMSDSEDADSVKLSSIIGAAGSLTIRVENQTQYATPGSRKTGGTAAAPKGGTASNLNDNDDSTVATTSALNDLSGQTVANRIIAKLTLAAATDLICLEARGVLGSAASSSNAMGLYYSTDSGANWTQAGAGFTLSTSAQNVQRTGSFAGVTDIAVVTEAKNWSTNTNTVAGLNAFDATIDATVGQAWIIGANAIGDFSGNEGKVAICEATDTLTIYTPQDGDEVYDKDTKTRVRWSSAATAWLPAASGYANVEYTEDSSSATLSSTGSNAAQTTGTGGSSWANYPTTAPTQTLNKAKILETLTAPVEADRADQDIEVRYNAGLVGIPTVTASTTAPAWITVLLGIYVDAETNARDWVTLFSGVAVPTDSAQGPAIRQMLIDAIFKLTLADTSAHTLKFIFEVRTEVASATNITAFSLTITRRRATVRKLN